MAVVTTPARPQAERVALRKAMIDLRLAELREGVWLRPDNLVRRSRRAWWSGSAHSSGATTRTRAS